MAERAPDSRAAVFDRLFADGNDPWGLATSAYERDKRAATLAAVGSGPFAHALEVGCAFGVLTAELAGRCDRLLAVDVSATALARAGERLRGVPDITLRRMEVPGEWPSGTFDLILWSEVLYFLSAEEIARCSALSHGSLTPGGRCVLVNWTGPTDLPVDGTAATDGFIAGAAWRRLERSDAERYRLDVLAAR